MKQKLFAFLTILVVFAMLPGPVLAAPLSARSTLHGSAPTWANSANFTGAADPNGGVGFRVYLGWRNGGAAEAFARSVSDPNSSQYRQYVTAAQFRKTFAPSQLQVKAVQSWLKSLGIYGGLHSHEQSLCRG